MSRPGHTTGVLALLVLLAGCGGEEPAGDPPTGAGEAMQEMDHSQHTGGAPETRRPVRLSASEERSLGVVYATVGRHDLERIIRTVGRIEPSESREAEVTPRVSGFVEELLVATTGEAVTRGQPLLTLYSPDLVAAQEELLTAYRLLDRIDPDATEAREGAEAMVEATRRRLAYWEVTAEQIERLTETGEVTRTLTLVSPVDGIVVGKEVVRGQRIREGETLYRITDLSTVWVEGDVFEQDLQFVREGTQAHIELSAYPGDHLMARVSFVYPTVDEASRTNRVRVTLDNPGLRLKPGMFVTVFFDVEVGRDVLAVPLEAVVVTGERNLVFVHEGDTLVPREVVLGARAGEMVRILSGLEEGEEIVASANFLVDAESRLGGGMGGMPGMQHAAPDTSEGGGSGEHRHD